jgi:predicted Zn finger-like uncharacterized protein
MQLACPACHTAFHIEAAALGAGGRSVRCARCRNTWFARPDDLIEGPAMAEVSAEGEAAAANVVMEGTAPILPQVVPWNDMVVVDVHAGPSIAPDIPSATAVPSVRLSPGTSDAPSGATPGRRKPRKSGAGQTRIGLIALLLGMIVVIGTTAREPIVQAMPDLAGYYAAIGMPVNLRGLEFRDLRTSLVPQDGVPVLVIEGEIVNPTRQTKDIPRLRLAVNGADEREIYSWTALLPRESLGARESLTFRSRLASPPDGSSRVVVRFLHRTDLTDSGD